MPHPGAPATNPTERPTVPWPRRRSALLGGLGYGLLTLLAFPPLNLWPLAFLAPLPLLLAALHTPSRPLRAGLWAALGVFPAWLLLESWLIDVTAVGYPLLAAGMSFFAGGFFVAIIVALRRSAAHRYFPLGLTAAVTWTGLEFLRGEVAFTGYPWYLAAHPLIEFPPLAAPAAWLGTYFVTFLLLLLLGGLVEYTRGTPSSRRLGLGMAGAAIATWMTAAAAAPAPDPIEPKGSGGAGLARIAAIQTNVPQSNKLMWLPEQRLQDWDRFAELTRQAAAADPKPDLIIWPETMFPGSILNPEALSVAVDADEQARADRGWGGLMLRMMVFFAERLLLLHDEIDTPMLVGASAAEGLAIRRDADGFILLDRQAAHNSALLLQNGGIHPDRYDKLHLTPFGEVIPYVWRWPALQRLILAVGARGMSFELSPGRDPHIFELALETPRPPRPPRPLRLATPICFEATMTSVVRALAYENGRPSADVLVNLSNDGWFGRFPGGRARHLQTSRWRSVELGIPMVRAVNTGTSAWIDHRGRLIDAIPPAGILSESSEGILIADIPLRQMNTPDGSPTPEWRGTLYGRTGNWFGWLMLAAAAGLAGISAWAPRPAAAPAP